MVIGAAVLAGAALGACGGDDGGSNGLPTASGGDSRVAVVALDTLEFDESAYTASAGEITFEFENGGSITHPLLIEGIDDFKLSVSARGDTDEGTVELESGEYRLWCDVPGHETMEATLTVE
jgi:plastocyanin